MLSFFVSVVESQFGAPHLGAVMLGFVRITCWYDFALENVQYCTQAPGFLVKKTVKVHRVGWYGARYDCWA